MSARGAPGRQTASLPGWKETNMTQPALSNEQLDSDIWEANRNKAKPEESVVTRGKELLFDKELLSTWV